MLLHDQGLYLPPFLNSSGYDKLNSKKMQFPIKKNKKKINVLSMNNYQISIHRTIIQITWDIDSGDKLVSCLKIQGANEEDC